MSSRTRRLFILILWLVIPLLLYWAVRDIHPAEVWATINKLSLGQIAILACLNACILLLMSARWWLIVRRQGLTVPFLSLFRYRLFAFGISYFTPGPQFGGEPAQVYLLKHRHAVPTASALASVSLDKILELLANLAFLLLGLAAILNEGVFGNLAPWHVRAPLVVSFLVLCGYSLALWLGKSPITRLLEKATKGRMGLQKIRQAMASAEGQISLFSREQPATVILASMVSLLVWVVMILEYWYVLGMLGLNVNLFQAVAALTAAMVAFLAPLPAGLGALEASQVLAMGALGLPPAAGIGASLLIRLRDVITGGLGLILGGLLSRQARPVARVPTAAWRKLFSRGG